MWRTRVGYAGDPGKSHPTYHDLGLHAEAVEIDYDPALLSYQDLLEIFFASHNPVRPPWSPQYRSAVFVRSEEEERLARAVLARLEQDRGRPLHTQIAHFDHFWLAEDYHQKYRLQRSTALKREYRAIFPDFADFLDSTAVARVNGYLDGFGSGEQLQEELDLLGLSEAGRQELLGRVTLGSR